MHVFWIDPTLKTLYPKLLLLDLLAWFTLNKLAARVRGYDVLLIDRFILDVIVDLLWEVRNTKFIRSMLIRSSWKYVESTIILTASLREVIRRKGDAFSLREVAFKKKCFEILAKHLNIPILNTTETNVIATFRELKNLLREG